MTPAANKGTYSEDVLRGIILTVDEKLEIGNTAPIAGLAKGDYS